MNEIAPGSSETPIQSEALVVLLFRWRKLLAGLSVIGLIASYIVCQIITPRDKSTVILYPVLTSTVSKTLLEENTGAQEDFLRFGEEDATDQVLQLLNSDELILQAEKRFGLTAHYGINPEGTLRFTSLKREFQRNISFKRTEYMSVKVEVLDRNKDTAAAIANHMAALADSVKNRVIHDRAGKAFTIVDEQYREQINEILIMEDSMNYLRKNGLFDYEIQVKSYSKSYANALEKGNKGAQHDLEQKMKIFEQFGGPYVSLKEKLWQARGRLQTLKVKHDVTKADMEKFLPFTFVVDRPLTAERKSYPVTWAIVLVSTFGSFLLGFVGVIVLERFSRINY